ncbi:heavy metal translocating P-type ATPase [Hydrotalea sp.]|uniref:heavy metal translocating P-type ATPase n=1 Tax=Hydrotalea sp. TaxID=2881279 RepID=UPI003D0F8CA6
MATEHTSIQTTCFHCGEDCGNHPIEAYDKHFCCEGCKSVYEILNNTGMCDYYTISQNPGNNQKIIVRENKFAFLDDESVQKALTVFKDNNQTHVTFYLPHMHCSSCLWLIENLHRLNKHIISSKVNFSRKEADIVFNQNHTSMRKVAELLTSIGYEPYISLQNLNQLKPRINYAKIYKLGVAGFCFANIMMLSFPEYLGIDDKDYNLTYWFRYLSLLLSMPVVFYSATEFYNSAFKSLKHKYLNIDTPIVLAIWVTFIRSIIEIVTNTGSGYLDSMSGIVFFMLVGRILQDKTYEQLNFDRDYTAYFPIAVSRIKNNKEETVTLPNIQLNDTLLIHHSELIPADGILTKGKALIDYSFVTGESMPVEIQMGEMIYAGGKQLGSNIELLVIKEVAQSYLTKLWNRSAFKKTEHKNEHSFVDALSRYFTYIVFAIATIAAVYWQFHNPEKLWQAVTAVLIVACPCALLLSNTFTNGAIIRSLGRNNFYLRNANTIETIAKVNYIVFDKTGTLTTGRYDQIEYDGIPLSQTLKEKLATLTAQSTHPLSKSIVQWLQVSGNRKIDGYKEIPGKGIEGMVEDEWLTVGTQEFVLKQNEVIDNTSTVYLGVEGKLVGKFIFKNAYRPGLRSLAKQLQKKYPLAVLSGDNAGEKNFLQSLLGFHSVTLFHQKPNDKLQFIEQLQNKGYTVMMIGDGLNDAGALQQANVGIAVSENSNNFTPASDVIIDATQLHRLPAFIQLAKANKKIIFIAFAVSILYNIIGLYFAVQGVLSPLIAAVLMPASTISIVLITYGLSNLYAKQLKLQ